MYCDNFGKIKVLLSLSGLQNRLFMGYKMAMNLGRKEHA